MICLPNKAIIVLQEEELYLINKNIKRTVGLWDPIRAIEGIFFTRALER